MQDIEAFSLLTSKIYAAALQPTLWGDVLQHVHDTYAGMKTHIFGYDLETRTNLGQIGAGYDPEFEASYGRHYFQRNVMLERYYRAPVGVPVRTGWMYPPDALRKTEFYADWLRPQEDIVGGGSILLFKEDGRLITFGSNIRGKDVDRTEDRWLRDLSLLGPHLRQAFEISRALAGRALEDEATDLPGDRPQAAMIVVTADRRLVHANAAARQMLETDAAIIRSGHRLTFAHPEIDRRISAALSEFRRGVPVSPVTIADVSLRPGENWTLRLAPIQPGRVDYSQAGLLIGVGEPAMLITIRRNASEGLRSRLCQDFGLTQHEADIAMLLAEGQSVSEIAQMKARSIHTVRNQIKSVMAKMDASRQAEVVRIVAAISSATTQES